MLQHDGPLWGQRVRPGVRAGRLALQLGEDLRIFLFPCQDRVAGGAATGDPVALDRLELPVVAAEAARRLLMTDVVRIGVPPHFHVGEDVHRVQITQGLAGLLDGRGFPGGDLRVALLVEGGQLRGDDAAGFLVALELLVDDAHAFALHERQRLVDAAVVDRVVHFLAGLTVLVARAVMAVYAVHGAPQAVILRCIGFQPDLLRAVRAYQAHLVDVLAGLVRAIAHLVLRCHMPMDTGGFAAVGAAYLQQDGRLQLGVFLVVGVGGRDLQLVAVKLGWPVTLLAGLPGRTQVVQRSLDGPRIEVEGHGDHLPCAVQLGLHEPVGAGADVALGAGHPGAGRALVGRVLGCHHRMAGHATELHGLHDLHALVGGASQHDDVQYGQAEEYHQRATGLRRVEVDDREGSAALVFRVFPHTPALEVDADGNGDQAEGEDRRKNQEGKDAQVRSALVPDRLHEIQRDDQYCADQRHGAADQADPVTRDGGEEMSGHESPRG